MYASELVDIIESNTCLKKVFGGIFPKDKLPNLTTCELNTDQAIIINSAPSSSIGEHWLLAYYRKNPKNAVWFDTFGNKPSYYGKEVADWFSKQTEYEEVFNSFVIQSAVSPYCGLFVLFFMYYLARGFQLKKIVKKFSILNLTVNDTIVKNFAKNVLRVKLKNL